MQGREPHGLPSFYWRTKFAKIVQQQGFPNITPATVGDMDPYDLQGALMMHQIENDPLVVKAGEDAKKKAKKGSGQRVKNSTKKGGHLKAVPDLVENR